jgi:hypothetical protein
VHIVIDGNNRFDNPQWMPMLTCQMRQCLRVFGKARAAVAWPWRQKLIADSAIKSHATGNIKHIATKAITQQRQVVDEGNLKGQKGIRGVLDELCRFYSRRHQGDAALDKRSIEIAEMA